MDRRSILRMSLASVVSMASGVALAREPTLNVDEAVGMLDADGLVELTWKSTTWWIDETTSSDELVWINRYRMGVDAAVRAGHAVNRAEGRRTGLKELKAFHGLERMHAAMSDDRVPANVRELNHRYVHSLPGFDAGSPPSRQRYAINSAHWYYEYAVEGGLALLEYGDTETARQIVAGKVDWRGLDVRWRAARTKATA
jgi:hypothetical protein